MGNVEFTDNRIKVEAALDDAVIAFLYEAAGEVEAQTKRAQTRVDTGQTKGAWTHHVDEDKGEAVIGNPLENAIWEEYGTGEYALKGNGRKSRGFIRMSVVTGTQLMVKNLSDLYRKPSTRQRARLSGDLVLFSIRHSESKAVMA